MNGPPPSFLAKRPEYKQPVLTIVRQPQKRGYRFRYASEGLTHGGIRGEPAEGEREEKIFPSIKISGYRGRAKVVVTIVTANDKSQETRLHAHSLVVNRQETKGYHVFEIDGQDPTLEMTTIAIQHIEKKQQEAKLMDRILQTQFLQKYGWSSSIVLPDAQQYSDLVAYTRALEDRDENSTAFIDRVSNTELNKERLAKLKNDANALVKSMDMTKCRLCFQAFCQDANGHYSRKLEPVYSDIIYDGKTAQGAQLKILRISKVASVVTGNEEVWIIGDRLNPDDIQVRLFEDKPSPQFPNGWEAFGTFNKTDVHKQLVLIFKTPEYHDKDIEQQVEVLLELRRKSDRSCTSEALKFKYIPNKDRYGLREKRKKAIPMDALFAKKQQLDPGFQQYATASSGGAQLPLVGPASYLNNLNLLNSAPQNLLSNGNLSSHNIFPNMTFDHLMSQTHQEQRPQQQLQYQQQQQQPEQQQHQQPQQQLQQQPQQQQQQQQQRQPRKQLQHQQQPSSLSTSFSAAIPSTMSPITNGVFPVQGGQEVNTAVCRPMTTYANIMSTGTEVSDTSTRISSGNSTLDGNIKTEDENYAQAPATLSLDQNADTGDSSNMTSDTDTLQSFAPKAAGLTNSMIMDLSNNG